MGSESQTIIWIPQGTLVKQIANTRLDMKMAYDKFFMVALSFLCNLSVVLTDSEAACYRIEPATMAGIICADVLLTIIIVIVTYHWASARRRKIEEANKVYMNVRANCKS